MRTKTRVLELKQRQVSRGTDNGPPLNFNLLNPRSLKRKTETTYSIGTPSFYRCDPALTGVFPNANTEHPKLPSCLIFLNYVRPPHSVRPTY